MTTRSPGRMLSMYRARRVASTNRVNRSTSRSSSAWGPTGLPVATERCQIIPFNRGVQSIGGSSLNALAFVVDLPVESGDPHGLLPDLGLVVEPLHRELVDSLPRVGNIISAIARPGEDPAFDGLQLARESRDRGAGPIGLRPGDRRGRFRLAELA